MQFSTVASIVMPRQPGAFATLVTRKDDATGDFNKTARDDRAKRFPFESLQKRSRFQMRLGHDYENQKSTQEARENGMGHKAPEDDYAERMAGDYGKFFATHKTKGTVYLVGQPTGSVHESEYFHNGQPVDPAILEPFRKPSKPKVLHLRIPVESIQDIR